MSSTSYRQPKEIRTEQAKGNWPAVIALFLLLAIPSVPAILIVASVFIGMGASELPLEFVNSLYHSQSWPVIVHGMSGILFFLCAPLQFSPAFRKKNAKFHKYSGYIVFVSGYIMALSGIWMHHVLNLNDFGPRYFGLVLMALAMCVSFSLALRHIINKNIINHQTWVIRALAITLGAVTYLFVEVAVSLTLGQIDGLKPFLANLLHDYGRITAIIINLVIAELLVKQISSKQQGLFKEQPAV